MEATQQAENTAREWTQAQLGIYDRWFEAIQSAGTPKTAEGWEQMRKFTLQSWEETVNSSLEAQVELSNIVIDALGAWAPEPQVGRQGSAVKQMQEAVRSWTEAQRQAWSSFFDIAKKVDVSTLTETWDKMMEASQQSVRKAWESQAPWFAVPPAPSGPEGNNT
jgi:hypothetical protein